MYFHEVTALLAIATVFIATYTDLKERIIPNKLTFSMIIVGIAAYLAYGAYYMDLFLAVGGGLGALLGFGIGYLMWYTGGWAGGDVKLFTALGALFGWGVFGIGGYEGNSFLTMSSFAEAPYPYPLTILFNGIVCLAPVLFIYVVVRSVQTPGVGKKIVDPVKESLPESLILPFVMIGGSVVPSELGSNFDVNSMITFVLGVVFILIIYRLPVKVKAPVAVGLTAYGIYLHSYSALKFLAIAFVIVFGIRFAISMIKVINREVLQEEVSISDLEEGMIPAETIYRKDGEVARYEGPGIKERAKRFLKNPKDIQLKPDWDEVLADSSYAAGVTDENIESLQECVEEGELDDSIRIKQGLPFAPSFAMGVVIAILFGDIYWGIVEILSGGM